MIAAVRIHERDNTATCLADAARGDVIAAGDLRITANEDIPKFHKVAIAEMRAGESCIKYGEAIGTMTRDVCPGDWVHVHNLASARGRGDLAGGGER